MAKKFYKIPAKRFDDIIEIINQIKNLDDQEIIKSSLESLLDVLSDLKK